MAEHLQMLIHGILIRLGILAPAVAPAARPRPARYMESDNHAITDAGLRYSEPPREGGSHWNC
jgi:hypothetical protein